MMPFKRIFNLSRSLIVLHLCFSKADASFFKEKRNEAHIEEDSNFWFRTLSDASMSMGIVPTASISPSGSPSISHAPSISKTPSISIAPSISGSPSISHAPSISKTPSISIAPSISGSPSISHTPSISKTPSISIAPSTSKTPTMAPSNSPTSSISPSIKPTVSPSKSPSSHPSSSLFPSVSPSLAPTVSRSPSISVAPSTSRGPTSSSSPSFSAAPSFLPSPDPENIACNLDAGITCTTRDGEPCDTLNSPVANTCIGGNAQELSFLYLSWSSCHGTNTQVDFDCTDLNTDITRPFDVHVSFSIGGDIFYESVVFSGQVFKVTIPDLIDEIQIKISTEIDGSAGVTLQESTMSVRCREQDGLTLLDTFGHLQLTGYRNVELGNQQVFADVDFSYSVTNNGEFDANLLSAIIDSPLSGIDQVVSQSDPLVLIGSAEVEAFASAATINLAASSGRSFEFVFEIMGEGTTSGKVCNAVASFLIQII